MDSGKKIETPARKCERCGAEMKFIVTLPLGDVSRPLNVFRRLSCGNAATEPIAGTQ